MNKAQRAETTRQMEAAFFHCPTCEGVFLGRQTERTFGWGDIGIWARSCPIDQTRLNRVRDEDVDLSVVDYLEVGA